VQTLKGQIINHPDTRKIIIAHSHGVNIALYALGKLQEYRDQFEVVTLSTPFLNAEKREISRNMSTYVYALTIFIGLSLTYILLGTTAVIWNHFAPMDKTHPPSAYFDLVILSVPLLCLLSTRWLIKQVENSLRGLPEEMDVLLKNVSLDHARDTKMLVVIDHNDEIKMFFSLFSRVWEFLMFSHSKVVTLLRKLMPLSAASFGLMCLIYLASGNETNWLGSKITNGLGIFIGATFGLAFCIPFLSSGIYWLFNLIKSNPMILGWEPLNHKMLIKTSPANTPFNYSNINIIQHAFKRKGLAGLKHSTYINDQVIEGIAKWIRIKGHPESHDCPPTE